MKKKKQSLPTHCKCVNTNGRRELTLNKVYEILGFEKDSKGVDYYKVMSDVDKVRHYEIYRFEVCDENTTTP